MKSFKYYWSMLAFVALLFFSCSTEETAVDTSPDAKNSAELTFGALLDNLANKAANKDHFDQVPDCSDAEPAVAVIKFSVDGGSQQTATVDILKDGNGYFTAYDEELKIAIPSNGSVSVELQAFMVYDGAAGVLNSPNGNLIWVAPVAPGDFAGYIDKPLPFSVVVNAGTKPYIDVEVLCFDRRVVNEYGYPFFDLVPSKVYPLCFFANLCIGDRHFVGNYGVDLYYDDGVNPRIQLYSDEQPVTENLGTPQNPNFSAKPVCLVVPDKPEGFLDSQDYLFYVITPKNWPAYYGNVDNTPLVEEGLSWNDVNGLLNDDEETNEYIHLFIGCDVIPGCIPGTPTPGDRDGDCLPDGDDPCPDDATNSCCIPGTPTQGDRDGDCLPDGDDPCPDDATNSCCIPGTPTEGDKDGDCLPDGDDPCPDDPTNSCDPGEECDGDETAFMQGDSRFDELQNGPNRWGWIEDFDIESENGNSYNIYAGASNQYNLNEDTKIGEVTITFNDVTNMVTLSFDFDNSLNGFSELHVNISDNIPSKQTLQAPGQYNHSAGAVSDGDSFSYPWNGDGDFYIVVHGADACKDGGNDE